MAKYQRGTPTEDGWYWITDSEDSPPSIGIFLRLETGYRLSVMNPVGVTTIHMEIEHVLWCKAEPPKVVMKPTTEPTRPFELLTLRRIAEVTRRPVSDIERLLDEHPDIRPTAVADYRPVYDRDAFLKVLALIDKTEGVP